MRFTAFLISIAFHPLLMATYGCLLLFFGIKNSLFEMLTPWAGKVQITITVFVFTFVLPVLNILIMYKLKKIKGITLSNPSERSFPYLVTAIFYFGLFYLLYDLRIWESIKYFILCAGIAILLAALINTRYKISAHMTGIGGITGMLIALSLSLHFDFIPYIIGSVIVGGFTGWARIHLKEHNPGQIYSGFLLGLSCQLLLFLLLDFLILSR